MAKRRLIFVYLRGSLKAFTIVELLVVIVVIAILATITIVSYTGITSKANIASLVSDLDNSSRLLKMYQVEHGAFPTSFDTNNCPLGATLPSPDTKYCIKPSSSNTYTYKASATNSNIFCLTSTKGAQSYNISPDTQPLAGPCPVLSLDAGNKTSYSGAGTTWNDLSGFDNNGTLINNVSFSTANGGAMSFDGVSNSRINVLYNFGVLQNYTVSFWAKHNASGNMPIASGSGDFYWYGDSSWRYVHGGVGDEYYYPKSVNIPNGTWGNFCVSYDGTNVSIYRNGVFEGKKAITGTANFSSGFTIGDWNSNTLHQFNGLISLVNIYRSALSSDEIKQNVDAQKARYGL